MRQIHIPGDFQLPVSSWYEYLNNNTVADVILDRLVHSSHRVELQGTNKSAGADNLQKYKNKYFELPKVIAYENRLFFIAPNIKKAKEMEEVMKFHIMVLEESVKSDKNFLELEEIAYLSNWEAEKFRRRYKYD